jgi:drug/metabolite transporter superfamily protein YnfA
MEKLSILFEIWEFLRVRKKWWLAPIVIILVLFGFVIVFAQASPLAPFIYTMF